MNTLRKLLKDESGATAIEYGLIAALVSVVIIGVLGTLGDNLLATFTTVSDGLGGAAGAPPPSEPVTTAGTGGRPAAGVAASVPRTAALPRHPP